MSEELILRGKAPRFRLAILASHPIQYQAPLFRLLAKQSEIDLTVLFCSDWGLKEYTDKGFGQKFKWDINLLDGYQYKFLKNISFFPNMSTFWGLINPSIIKILNKKDFDAVWIHGWARFSDWISIITCILKGIPILLRGESNLLPKILLWKQIIKRIILGCLFKNVAAFLAIGKYNTEFYEFYGVPKEKIFLVPYTVDNDFFISKAEELLPKKDEIRKEYNVPIDLPLIMFSGKLIPQKKPMDLLKAFEILSKEIKAGLMFVGDGILRKELENYCSKNNLAHVYFMGFRNQTELPKFYAMSDVFVLPSSHEPWGLVVNEAMCFKLPVIVSDQVGASRDLVKEGVNGFVYAAGNVSALSSKLKILLYEKEKIKSFGQISKEIITEWSYNKGVLNIIEYLGATFCKISRSKVIV